jgi:probable phosphoglycerate mutase
MELLLIRHGDPDYPNHTLTPRGHEEAKCLANFLADVPLAAVFQSPMGRAQHTCAYTAEIKGITPITLDWLCEAPIKRGDLYLWGAPGLLFLGNDLLPGHTDWFQEDGVMPEGRERFAQVAAKFDELIRSFGYDKQGHLYKVRTPYSGTIAFFAHAGTILTLLSYLLHWPLPLIFVQARIDPTGLTRVSMEEHDGVAQPTLMAFNCLTHLPRSGGRVR